MLDTRCGLRHPVVVPPTLKLPSSLKLRRTGRRTGVRLVTSIVRRRGINAGWIKKEKAKYSILFLHGFKKK